MEGLKQGLRLACASTSTAEVHCGRSAPCVRHSTPSKTPAALECPQRAALQGTLGGSGRWCPHWSAHFDPPDPLALLHCARRRPSTFRRCGSCPRRSWPPGMQPIPRGRARTGSTVRGLCAGLLIQGRGGSWLGYAPSACPLFSTQHQACKGVCLLLSF